MHSQPSQRNASAWEQDSVLTRLISRGREAQMDIDMHFRASSKATERIGHDTTKQYNY
jgi:hypothetical protein